ncbi:unnamed protein product [Paramecium primaurelia]|uniref:Uncharacterized protein n=1 Tax=Paramecium primaurelia TaxID=5886 RepID=A0A8S1NIX2_PARPR|nr:unnamed protein product [Paramecium primaurelia]
MRKVTAKVLVVGSSAVGKSALIQLYTTGEVNFLKDYQLTQIAEISTKLIPFEQEEKDVELYLFDIAGSEIYEQAILKSNILKDANFVFLCYDMTKETTYEAAKEWFERVTKANGKKLPGVLVAMKSDLQAIRKIENKQGMQLANQLGLSFFSLSTARNQDIDHPFQHIAQQLII